MFTVDKKFVNKLQSRLDYLAERKTPRTASSKKPKVVPLILDLRRILVSAKVKEGLKLVPDAQPGCLSLVDGHRLVRAADGTVDILQDETSEGLTLRSFMHYELLKLGDKGTHLLTERVITRLLRQHVYPLLGVVPDYSPAPVVTLEEGSFAENDTDKDRMYSLLTDLSYQVMQRYAGNFWGEPKHGSTLGSAIWRNILDAEVASLTLKLFGARATLRHYNLVVSQVAVLRQLNQETPNLMRLLGSLRDASRIPQLENGIPLNAIQLMREYYLDRGFTPAAWAFMTRQGSSVVPSLAALGAPVVNRLAELQCGKLPHGRWLHTLSNRIYMVRVAELGKLLVLFAQAYAKRKVKAQDLNDNLLFLLDYFYQTKAKIGSQSTFQGLVRKQAEWHRKLAHEEGQRQLANLKELYTWQPLVQSVELGNLRATSLNSSLELIEEGSQMSHCVGGYFRQCYDNRARIYSLTVADQRVATLEVSVRNKRWEQGQLHGLCNSKITDKKVIQLARRVVSACNKAPALDAKLNTVQPLRRAEATSGKAGERRVPLALDERMQELVDDLIQA